MLNPDLCQAPMCANAYTKIVSGWDEQRGGHGWSLHLCDFHAEVFEKFDMHQQDNIAIQVRPRGCKP